MNVDYRSCMFSAAGVAVLFSACSNGESTSNEGVESTAEVPYAEPLFGLPSEESGLTTEQCAPVCDGDGPGFFPPTYTASEIETIGSMTISNPLPLLGGNPYDTPEQYREQPDKACGYTADPTTANAYSLHTFDSPEAAVAAGATVTHTGACGLCSPMVNLAVYMKHTDLSGPVRQCGLMHISGSKEDHIRCLRQLGFDLPCAEIWYFNTKNTGVECLVECLEALGQPHHSPTGAPNACIECDEEKSGPVFKAVAGRTRRNSGLPTALCRPCSTVSPIEHRYD